MRCWRPILLLGCCFSLSMSMVEITGPDLLWSASPVEVFFVSTDYRNILHWKLQTPIREYKYSVQYKIYGDKHWTNATHCQSISQLSCDLSRETAEPRQWYYARVRSALLGQKSNWVLSPRFNPYWETSVSPPQVKLRVTKQGIVVRLKAPRSPFTRSNGKPVSMRKLQNLSYRIYVSMGDEIHEWHEVAGCVTELLLRDLRAKSRYCLQAEAHLERMGRTSLRTAPVCITSL